YFANPGIHGRLKSYFGFKDNEDEKLREVLGIDFREIEVSYMGSRLHPEIPGMNVNPVSGMRTRWTEHEYGGYWEICDYPLKDADEEQAAAWPIPSADDFDYCSAVEVCRKYENYAISIGWPPDIINNTGRLRTMEQVMVDLATDDLAGLLIIDRRLSYELEVMYRTLEAAKGKIDFLFLGEDLSTQRGPLISMELFRKHIKPRIKKFTDLAKAFSIPAMLHSCGSSSWAFDDLIEIGVNIVDTLQPEAKDMNPAYLKKRFGDRLAFHGCISTAGPVAYGSVQDVVDNVREVLEIMMPGGGYCFSPTHALQDNSPVENVIAMYETALRYGYY
ncbi:MAG: uroporphyrinogen decarboxylase family protein, partial [Clostridiales bacterium]|nr:uroporphyrinogen decarboxylase family protein [Clostridiales bacterium]